MRYDTNGKLSRTYRKWSSMLQRCENPKHPAYRYYGGRGITVCERWHNYDAFALDMGPAPEGHWIDRIDNTHGYEPGNCRWVTPKQSAANRHRKGGAPINLASLRQRAIAAGQPYHRVYQRVMWGWPVEDALAAPAGSRRP